MIRTLAVMLAAALLAGCVEMAAIGVGAAVLSHEDRRTTGTIVEDESLKLRADNRISSRFGSDKVHVNVTAFNRYLLLTGEAPDAATKAEIEKIVWELPTKPLGVTNDIRIAAPSPMGSISNDSFITGKVKARFLDANRFNAVHVKVVTEAGVVYLMGIVTEAEAEAAVNLARTTGGVRRVVKVFEHCKPTDAVCRPRQTATDGAPKPQASN
jgi:osmotically-inducible protein OsmY